MIGITTYFRSKSTLETTIDSLIQSGVGRKEIILFCDGGYNPSIDMAKVVHPTRLGAWKNWYRSLQWLYENTADELLFLFQDDVVFCKNWREYFYESGLPDDAAIYSIFSPAHYTSERGWTAVDEQGSLHMAQTYIIRRSDAKDLLDSRIVWTLRGTTQIDNRVGLWLHLTKRKIVYHTPSLAEHIGDTSTLWRKAKANGIRVSQDFIGEETSALSLI